MNADACPVRARAGGPKIGLTSSPAPVCLSDRSVRLMLSVCWTAGHHSAATPVRCGTICNEGGALK
jgi:hypothetical protein